MKLMLAVLVLLAAPVTRADDALDSQLLTITIQSSCQSFQGRAFDLCYACFDARTDRTNARLHVCMRNFSSGMGQKLCLESVIEDLAKSGIACTLQKLR